MDLDTSERLGGGAFAVQSGSMYEQYDGYRLGKAQRVKELTRNLNNSYFHLERQAFSVANFDWIMIDADRCVVSHFFTDDDRTIHKYFPPLYDRFIFDALDRRDGQDCVVKNSCAAFFFMQKRCAHANSIVERLTLKRYEN